MRRNTINAPRIEFEDKLGLEEAIQRFSPTQGGIEFQTDQPGKVHSWHMHSVNETLIVINGAMRLDWAKDEPDNVVGSTVVSAGAIVHLPSGTIHQSTAQDEVCQYLILPEGGKAAETKVF